MTDQKIKFRTFNKREMDANAFFKYPMWLLYAPQCRKLSSNARELYVVLMGRMSLSVRNKMYDRNGNIYCMYSHKNLMALLGCGARSLTKYKQELIACGLLREARQGFGKPNRLYVNELINFDLEAEGIDHEYGKILDSDEVELSTRGAKNAPLSGAKNALASIEIDLSGIQKEGEQESSVPPVFVAYGDYSQVKLTDEQYKRLLTKMSQEDLTRMIRQLDNYMASTGRTYKNHEAAILNWYGRENKPAPKKKNAFINFTQRAYSDEYFALEELINNLYNAYKYSSEITEEEKDQLWERIQELEAQQEKIKP